MYVDPRAAKSGPQPARCRGQQRKRKELRPLCESVPILIVGLSVSLGILTVLSLQARTARADEPGGLYCYDLKHCNGGAGCDSGGQLDGCTIRCTGGGKADCDPIPELVSMSLTGGGSEVSG